ncbi:MAG TPA: hypothetical protein VLQ93_01535 [Myxococcaceae bacterium]|nr:hypothetical protein [Myxococcaceae bacterium]
MLYALENLLADALTAALPKKVKVRAGPGYTVPNKGLECVDVAAWGVESLLPEGEESEAGREPAFLTRQQQWDADGEVRDFTLPEGVEGEVLEVESPPGHPARRGEHFQVEGRTLRFYRPPAAGKGVVVATLHTGPAAGSHERRPCQGRLTVVAWADGFPRTDELLDQALAVVLRTSVDTGAQEARHLGEGVRLRLLSPTVALESVERTQEKATRRLAPRAEARLRLRGHLELTVAVGPAEPASRIEELRYTGNILRPRP